MKNAWIGLFLILFYKAGWGCSCVVLPIPVLDTIAEGVVEVYQYQGNLISIDTTSVRVPIDTVYERDLANKLIDLYNTSSLVLWGKVDSIHENNFPFDTSIVVGDTTIFSLVGVIRYLDINVRQVYKGELNPGLLTLSRNVIHRTSCDYGYSSIDQWEFLNFSHDLDSINDLDIYPAYACSRAGGIRVINGRIHHSEYPGVSISLTEFESLVGVSSIFTRHASGNDPFRFAHTTNGKVHLEFSDASQIEFLRLVDISGEMVFATGSFRNKTLSIENAGLGSGVYFLQYGASKKRYRKAIRILW